MTLRQGIHSSTENKYNPKGIEFNNKYQNV